MHTAAGASAAACASGRAFACARAPNRDGGAIRATCAVGMAFALPNPRHGPQIQRARDKVAQRRYRLSPCASWCPAEASGRGTAEGSPPRKWAEGTAASHGRKRDRRPSRQRGTAPPRPPPPRHRRPRRTPRGAAPALSLPLSPHASSLPRIRTVRDNFRRPFALIARRAAKRFRRAALR